MTREERASLDRERWKLDGKGDHVAAKPPSDAYRDGWERVFGAKHRREDRAWTELDRKLGRALNAPNDALRSLNGRR